MRKAFDSIYRNGLWFKLYKCGIRGKMLNIMKSMYCNIKSCVKHLGNKSIFFESLIGLKQGEVLSPLLFSLFVEDLEMFILNRDSCGLTLEEITVILLLFADDMVILAETPEDLKKSLNTLYEYCNKWSLEVNTEKTKVMVFRKRKVYNDPHRWYYGNDELCIVCEFNYLGVVLNYNGRFIKHSRMVTGKALKSLNVLMSNTRQVLLSPKIACQLFDVFVGSVLMYGTEMWGFTKETSIEKVHLKFCKKLLSVKLSASNAATYGEHGRFPLYICKYTKILKYWFKILYSNNCILRTVYNVQYTACENDNVVNWVSNVKKLLCENGFQYVWINPYCIDPHTFVMDFKNRLIDCFKQKWYADITDSRILYYYKHVKTTFGYEHYLDKIVNPKLRSVLTKLRISAHNLRVETGRYGRNRLERNERKCLICANSNDIEDEYHFIILCNVYNDLRVKYLPSYLYTNPSVHKFVNFFNTCNKNNILRMSKYIKEATERRDIIISEQPLVANL